VGKKTIQVDILDATGEVKIETKGYEGKSCTEESEWVKQILGEEQSRQLTSCYFMKGKEKVKKHISLCG
jgi:hypothetical protein